MYLRRGSERGNANFGWLNSFHSFSFGSYYDQKHMGFSALRVINDDTVAAGAGFDTHGHRDMEIISYVLKGALEHKDTMGNTQVVPAGDIQRMSAGSGVMHSEYNASQTDNVHFLQIWVQPNVAGIAPEYEQKTMANDTEVELLMSPTGRDGSLSIHQDVNLYRLKFDANSEHEITLENKSGYLHIISGDVSVSLADGSDSSETVSLSATDGLGIDGDGVVRLTTDAESFEALWFELPKVH